MRVLGLTVLVGVVGCTGQLDGASGASAAMLECEVGTFPTPGGDLVVRADGSACVGVLARGVDAIEVRWEPSTALVRSVKQTAAGRTVSELFHLNLETGAYEPFALPGATPTNYFELVERLETAMRPVLASEVADLVAVEGLGYREPPQAATPAALPVKEVR